MKLVQEAQSSKAPAQLLADRASQRLVLIAVVIGLLTFAVWFWGIGQPLFFARTLTIWYSLSACPDALGCDRTRVSCNNARNAGLIRALDLCLAHKCYV